MAIKNLPVPQWLDQHLPYNMAELEVLVRKHWKKGLVILVFLYLASQKDITIDFNVSSSDADPAATAQVLQTAYHGADAQTMNVSMLGGGSPKSTPAKAKPTKAKPTKAAPTPVAPAKPVLSPEEEAKRKKQLAYVKRFADVATREMGTYGIPASITLAQGILESNMGESKLATRNNNHFGIKCFSRSCKAGHCTNFTDDSHKDFFRKYGSSWDSYRAHSQLLQGDRYKHLRDLGRTDYRAWAHGLKKAGYATDKRYAEKLIRYIEDLDLHQYDK